MTKIQYYNPNKLLSYNRILNFVIGARGIGKSFAFKEYPIKRFLKHKKQWIYVRRFKSELKKINNYFSDVAHKFPDVEFKVKGKEFYINGELAGWAIPLSTWQSEKSNAYPNVETIIFDEFIREKDKSGYLPNEVNAFLNLMDTVFRTRDNVRAVCLSNAVTLANPYFIYFKISPDVGKRFNAYENIVVEIPDSLDFAEERKKTKFGSLIAKTEYGEMALYNEFSDNYTFVEKRTKQSKFQFAIQYQGMIMGIWVDVGEGLMYVSQDYDPSTKKLFALTTNDLSENTMLLNNWRDNYYLYKMVRAFKFGYLRFDNLIIRNTMYEVFNKMRIF